MLLGAVLDRFAQKTPVTVMTRAILEHALTPSALDALFVEHAEHQYQDKLLFSSVVDLMGLVVCKVQPSVNAAYQAVKETLPVSLTAVYDKLNRLEPATIASLVRHVGARLGPVIRTMGGQLPEPIPGYRTKIVDGNHLAATDRRIAELRESKAGPLPGHALVVLDPSLMLAIDLVPCEDAHAQERSLFGQLLERVEPKDVWVADRNFCTAGFLAGVAARAGYFIIRQHAHLTIRGAGTLRRRGVCDGGTIFEQKVTLEGEDGAPIALRRVVIRLDVPTRKGDAEVAVLTNLPSEDASALVVARVYRQRWSIERLFHALTQTLNGEMASLGYPGAALFAFAVALVSYNMSSVIYAALRAEFGHERVQEEVSGYYIANEVRVMHGGLDVMTEDNDWTLYRTMSPEQLGVALRSLASKVRLPAFKRHPRGPKKPVPPRTKHAQSPHVSTARLLRETGRLR
jgi:IS4 transposase